MHELILYVLALGFIWGAWGFWWALGIMVVHSTLSWLFRPKHDWETNWFAWVLKLAVIVIGVFAVNAIWQNGTITAIAAAAAATIFAMQFIGD